MKRERLNLVLIACTCLLLLAVHFGIKQFTLNSQAQYMWTSYGHDPLEALLSGHHHGLRYIVYYPAFAVADFLGIPANLAFTYMCVVGLVLMSIYVGRVLADVWGYSGYVLRRDVVTIAIFAVAVLMNGRMILPFLGYLLVIFVGTDWLRQQKWRVHHTITLAVGVLLTSLSSGTLPVAMALTAGIAAIAVYRASVRLLDRAIVSMAALLILFSVPALMGIGKNIAYFGGDVAAPMRMVDHGMVRDLLPAEIRQGVQRAGPIAPEVPSAVEDTEETVGPVKYWWAVALFWAGAAWWRGWRPAQAWRTASPGESILQAAIGLALVGGIFAYSVLALGLVPLLILSSGALASMLQAIRNRASHASVGS